MNLTDLQAFIQEYVENPENGFKHYSAKVVTRISDEHCVVIDVDHKELHGTFRALMYAKVSDGCSDTYCRFPDEIRGSDLETYLALFRKGADLVKAVRAYITPP